MDVRSLRAACAAEPDAPGRPAPACATLPQMPRPLALLRNRAFALLQGLEAPDSAGPLTLKVGMASTIACGPWLRFSTAAGLVALQPRLIDGRPAVWPTSLPSVALAQGLAACARLEPLLRTLEDVLGLGLAPCDLGDAPPVELEVDLCAAGEIAHRVGLALDSDVLRRAARRSGWQGLAACAAVPCALQIAGPSAPLDELPRLATGDLLLGPAPARGGWTAWLEDPAGIVVARGAYRPGVRRLRVQALEAGHRTREELMDIGQPGAPAVVSVEEGDARGGAAGADNGASAGVGAGFDRFAGLRVPLRIRLPEVAVPVRQLATLGPGCVLDLTPRDELKAEVLAAGVLVARGVIVSLGPGYGVLVEETVSP